MKRDHVKQRREHQMLRREECGGKI